jgi:glycerophosphoryl diester phosphodiesterase
MIKILAHRGVGEPENSIEAFKRAIDLNITGIELDVQRTADNIWIVFHDDKYQGLNISNTVCKDLKEKLPVYLEFDKVLNEKSLRENWINIELKVPRSIKDPIQYGEDFGKYLKSLNLRSNANISSFNYKALFGLRKAAKSFRLSYLSLWPLPRKWEMVHKKIKLYSVNVHPILLRKRHVEKAKVQNVEVHVWTVNKESTIEKILDLGVDLVITDNPKLVQDRIKLRL